MQYHTIMFNLIPYNTMPSPHYSGLGVPSLSPCHSNFAKLSCSSMASFLLVVFRINSTTTNETARLYYLIFTATISAKHCRNQQNRNLLIRKKLFRIYFIKLLQLCFFFLTEDARKCNAIFCLHKMGNCQTITLLIALIDKVSS